MNKYIVDLVLKDAKEKGQHTVRDYRSINQWLIYNTDDCETAFIEFQNYEFRIVSHNGNNETIHSTHTDLLEAINKIKEMK